MTACEIGMDLIAVSLPAFIIGWCALVTVALLTVPAAVNRILNWWDDREQARVDALLDPEGGES